jgi:hypothetical protein
MLLNRDQYPSWLYPVKQVATTISERWYGHKPAWSSRRNEAFLPADRRVGDGLALEHLVALGEAALRRGTIGEAISALERELARESRPKGRDTPSPLGE